VAACTTTTVEAATCRFGRVAVVAAARAVVRVVVAVVAASVAAVTVVVARRVVVSDSVDQTVVAIGLLSKGCRRRCPEFRVRARHSATGRVRVRHLAIGQVVLVVLAHRSAIGRVVRAVRDRRSATVAHALAVPVVRVARDQDLATGQAARRR
jgi:hypothetical protein